MSNIPESNIEESHSLTSESNKFDKAEYQREYMRKKRAEEKVRRDSVENRMGGLDASEALIVNVGREGFQDIALTPTDRKFEAQRPEYWIYGREVVKRECWKCGNNFETRLEMNKFCGPKCKEDWLSMTFGKLRSNNKKDERNHENKR